MAGRSGGFQAPAVVNNAAVNTGVQVSLQGHEFVSFGSVPRSGTAGSLGGSIFTVSENPHAVFFRSSCAHRQCMRVIISFPASAFAIL